MRPLVGDSHTDDDIGGNSAPDHGNGFRQLTELTKPRSRSQRSRDSVSSLTPDDSEIAIWISRLQSQFRQLTNPTMSALRTPTREAPRHTARPPTARDSTPEGGTSTTHTSRTIRSSTPRQLGHGLTALTDGSKQTALTDGRTDTACSIKRTDGFDLLRTTTTRRGGISQRQTRHKQTNRQSAISQSNTHSNNQTFNQHSFHSNNQSINRHKHSIIQSGTTGGWGES
jgi:hypothetical protein